MHAASGLEKETSTDADCEVTWLVKGKPERVQQQGNPRGTVYPMMQKMVLSGAASTTKSAFGG